MIGGQGDFREEGSRSRGEGFENSRGLRSHRVQDRRKCLLTLKRAMKKMLKKQLHIMVKKVSWQLRTSLGRKEKRTRLLKTSLLRRKGRNLVERTCISVPYRAT